MSSFCKSSLVVCIPRVLSVSALRLWCEYGVLGRGVVGWSWLLRLGLSGFLVSCEWGKFGVSLGGGLGGFGSVSGIEDVVLRACVVGDWFHTLHWNILSWFGCCTNVFRSFLFG